MPQPEVKSPTLPPYIMAPPPMSTAPPLLSQMYPSYLHYTAPPAAFYFPAQSYHPSPFPDFVALPSAPPPTTPMGMPVSIPFGSTAAGYYSAPTATQTATPTVPPQTSNQGHSYEVSKKGSIGLKNSKKEKAAAVTPNKNGSMSTGRTNSSVASSRTSNSSHVLSCDLCSLTFPSLSVLNNHIKGSRHTRKVKSQVAYKQMKAAGMNFKSSHETSNTSSSANGLCGEIQCEVCRVSVNSSHQLQAHLAGHKHKIRCYKRGLDPCAAMITPTSTPPSTAPSECSAPRSSVSSKYHQYTASTGEKLITLIFLDHQHIYVVLRVANLGRKL